MRAVSPRLAFDAEDAPLMHPDAAMLLAPGRRVFSVGPEHVGPGREALMAGEAVALRGVEGGPWRVVAAVERGGVCYLAVEEVEL